MGGNIPGIYRLETMWVEIYLGYIDGNAGGCVAQDIGEDLYGVYTGYG